MNSSLSSRASLLHAAAAELRTLGRRDIGNNPLFSHDIQELDGFQLAFMDPARFRELCMRCGVDPESSEAIMMQARMATRAHVHNAGDSLFLPLGPSEGFDDSEGGTYMGPYHEGQGTSDLGYVPAKLGETFHVPAGQIHFFQPRPGATFSAIACVSPRIHQGGGVFDIKHLASDQITLNP